MGKIRVVMCPADRPPYITNISNRLENMQKIVGGYIEHVGMCTDVVMICNEEGLIRELPENKSLPISGIRGDAFLCGVNGSEYADVPEKYANWLLHMCRERWKAVEHEAEE